VNKKIMALCGIALLSAVAPAMAQTSTSPLTDASKGAFDRVKGFITKAADQVAEADYAFKPTADVRSFGQLLGHVADANYMMCSAVAGEKAPAPAGEIEKTKTTKADLKKALADSFTYCDKVYAGVTDATGTQTVAFFGGQFPKLAVLGINNNHDYEHYGNIVTYMRLKGMVPPSSQKGGM
jgi:uncharacterized damage-inducible protein DinB